MDALAKLQRQMAGIEQEVQKLEDQKRASGKKVKKKRATKGGSGGAGASGGSSSASLLSAATGSSSGELLYGTDTAVKQLKNARFDAQVESEFSRRRATVLSAARLDEDDQDDQDDDEQVFAVGGSAASSGQNDGGGDDVEKKRRRRLRRRARRKAKAAAKAASKMPPPPLPSGAPPSEPPTGIAMGLPFGQPTRRRSFHVDQSQNPMLVANKAKEAAAAKEDEDGDDGYSSDSSATYDSFWSESDSELLASDDGDEPKNSSESDDDDALFGGGNDAYGVFEPGASLADLDAGDAYGAVDVADLLNKAVGSSSASSNDDNWSPLDNCDMDVLARKEEEAAQQHAALEADAGNEEDAFRYDEDTLINEDDIDESSRYDWNGRFQKVWQTIIDQRKRGLDSVSLEARMAANVSLLHLSQDFVHSAKTYGKIIISEVYLSDEQKTIRPIAMGGVAGGDKYIVQKYVTNRQSSILVPLRN
jgi:Clustered mitochondria